MIDSQVLIVNIIIKNRGKNTKGTKIILTWTQLPMSEIISSMGFLYKKSNDIIVCLTPEL